MSAGTAPPLTINYHAATVPILQLALSGAGLNEQQLFDLGFNTVRTPLVTVKLIAPTSGAVAALELPVRVEAWARAPIYACVSGYLQNYKVDIGTPVKAGQVLATIETPDVDQQLLQAQGELAVARSTLALADTTSARWKTLRAVNAVSAQEADDKLGDATARRAHVQALSANVQRMQQMQRYAKLVAPFDGMSRRATSMWAR